MHTPPRRLPRILILSPLERPDVEFVRAAAHPAAFGFVDLGRDRSRDATTCSALSLQPGARIGARIPDGVTRIPVLPDNIAWVVVGSPAQIELVRDRSAIVQVTSLDEARQAIAAGARALIAKGNESGGRIGSESAFVLLQRLLPATSLPVFVQGGIGLHSAAACLAGGAAGVVLDNQLSAFPGVGLPHDIRQAIAAMDGSETTELHGYRVYRRPDLDLTADTDTLDGVLSRLGVSDLRHGLLPLGQDTAFARSFAERFGSPARLIAAIERSIDDSLAIARETRPLAPDSPLARRHNVRFPIAQGPMTRVSDRATFAAAVAEAGAIPFLALSLLRGPQVRELLRDTALLMHGRTWGVGILGFVPPELREEQMRVLEEIRPPVAIIAGGRPSQARPLEAAGTVTYLHVPSPGLLDMFLNDGGRKFVFEGRECGGHVGPRSSFTLWESQIARLLASNCVHELELLFAGGIHDARSAAMVAAMAAPLVERGAKIGVLMGTAYLFTHEAVNSGAIVPLFQTAALECTDTVLLETAPGHATRCVDSAYVAAFEGQKRELAASGSDSKQAWAALEQLNVGRLRIAAKGVTRDGESLRTVDEDEQRRDGMYMIGQVAALRSSTCSMLELHDDVSSGSTEMLRSLAARASEPTEEAKPCDVAIVGMACIYPDAPDLAQFWSNILQGKNAITEVPAQRWNQELYFDPEATTRDAGVKTPSKWGGFLPEVRFDPTQYGIPPRSLAAIEPVQLLALEVARRALADAGYDQRPFPRERTSVIFGAEAGTDLSGAYGFRAVYPTYAGPIPPELDAVLPKLSEDSFPGILANVIAGRIANRLDLGGSNFTVDAACAASLAAIDQGIKELVLGTSDVVLCGGADLHNGINDYLMFASVHALSPSGQCRTFDAHADGIALGEGVACVVLKRLADAERDGDRVYAVIKGIAGSSDGRSLGLTAPRKEGQIRALERAYSRSGVSAADVGLVEAHGTGTVVGDRTELATLTEVYSAAGASSGSVALGSVKSQIGHTKCAAGLAGIIKAALALHHGVRPPTLNVETPNPAYDATTSPFRFYDRARPWVGERRHAAVSAFGFGGTNYHAVLAAHDRAATCKHANAAWPAELFLFRAPDRARAHAQIVELQRLLAMDEPWRLRDLARTISEGRGETQVAIVARDLNDLRTKLEGAANDRAGEGVYWAEQPGGPIAFLFPGQGSQKPGMFSELFTSFPRLQSLLALRPELVDVMFPPAAHGPEQRKAQMQAITDTRVAQPALGIAGLAMARLLAELDVSPAFTGGHSYGELVALACAGVFDPKTLLELSCARARAIVDAATSEDRGAMAAVAAAPDDVRPHLPETCVIANHNAPGQTVIAGPTLAIEHAIAQLGKRGLAAQSIPVACAFHSPLIAGARDRFAAALADACLHEADAAIEVWSNTSATPYPQPVDAIRERLAEHIVRPVEFVHQIEGMYAKGARVFVEVGPGRVLGGLVDKILGDRPHHTIATNVSGDGELFRLLDAVARLACLGVPVDPSMLFDDRDALVLDLQQPPRTTPSTWVVNGHLARPLVGELPPGAMHPVTKPVVHNNANPSEVTVVMSAQDQAMVEYLQGMRELIDAQRQVMLKFLGETQVAARAPVQSTMVLAARSVPTDTASIAAQPAAPTIAHVHSNGSGAVAPAHAPQHVPPTLPLAEVLLDIVSTRTGYPKEMLALDLDLEAELSIDSIKRIEILGELDARLGGLAANADAGQDRDAIIEQLANIKTLQGIIDWLENRKHSNNDTAVATTPAALPTSTATSPGAVGRSHVPTNGAGASLHGAAVEQPTPGVPEAVQRFAIELTAAPNAANQGTLSQRTFAISADHSAMGELLAVALQRQGARVIVIEESAAPTTKVDAWIGLAIDTRDGDTQIKRLFAHARAVVLGGATMLIGITGQGGSFGRDNTQRRATGGLPGMLKTIAKEAPDTKVRILDIDPKAISRETAELLLRELPGSQSLLQIGMAEHRRVAPVVVPAALRSSATAHAPVLDENSVVLLTGGARGITAAFALEFARRYRCKLELVGRTPEPTGIEHDAFRDASDAAQIRQILIRLGQNSAPAAIEKACTQILAEREIRRNLAAIRATGATLRHHAVDVRDAGAFRSLIAQLYREHGRIDGVVHGAGVIEDKLLRHKTAESFDRVYDTKIVGARAIVDSLRPDAQFVVFFSSVASAFGNRGQVDYATANDVLDTMAWQCNREIRGRCVSINWGPWEGGMVSDALRREYERKGIGLIPVDEGVACLFDELAYGDPACAQVIYMRASLDGFGTQQHEIDEPPRAEEFSAATAATKVELEAN